MHNPNFWIQNPKIKFSSIHAYFTVPKFYGHKQKQHERNRFLLRHKVKEKRAIACGENLAKLLSNQLSQKAKWFVMLEDPVPRKHLQGLIYANQLIW